MKMATRAAACCAFTVVAPVAAYAQGSVTLTGILDAGVTYVSNIRGNSSTYFDDGIAVPNLLTFKGTEDLGGGNKAVFELSSQFSLSNGKTIPGPGQIFNRTAYVGLLNERLGKLTFGNQYDFMFDTLTLGLTDGGLLFGGIYDFRQGPFSALGVPNNPTGSFDFDRMAGATRVPNSVKYQSPDFLGFSAGAMYGFGGTAGDFSANSTKSFGASYENGPVGVDAAYVDVRYPQLGNGHDGIRNFGFGGHYRFPRVFAMLVYTNTKNTASGARIDVYKASAQWEISGPWVAGLDYQFMKGNSVLQNNQAQQVTAVLQYHFSKRTMIYMEGIYQHARGDGGTTGAWINAVSGAASGSSQSLARIGLQTRF